MKIYILSLMVDQRYGSGNTTESQWISMDKAKIEKKKETEWKNLLSYFNIELDDELKLYDEDGTLYESTEEECVKCVSDYCKQYNIETKRASDFVKDWYLERYGDHDRPINGWMNTESLRMWLPFLENRKCGYDYTQKNGTKVVCGCDIKNPIWKGDWGLEDIKGGSYKIYSNNPEEQLIRELEQKGDICYYNTDLDSFPSLIIEEVKVTKEVKEF